MALTAYLLIFVFGICHCFEIEKISSNEGFKHGGLMIQRLVEHQNHSTGLLYDKNKEFLVSIDYDGNLFSTWQLKTGKVLTTHLTELGEERLAFVTLYGNNGLEYVMASDNNLRFLIFDNDNSHRISDPFYIIPEPYSFQAGRCGDDGVLYALVSSGNTSAEAKSKLYRMSQDAPPKVVQNFTNYVRDFTFTEDSKGIITIENYGMTLQHFDYDKESGSLTNKREIFNMQGNHECFGSMWSVETDAKPNVWVLAKAELGRLFKIDPFEKKILANVVLPMTSPTKLTFGGKNQKQLFIGSNRFEDCNGCYNMGGSIWGVSGFEEKGSIDYPIKK